MQKPRHRLVWHQSCSSYRSDVYLSCGGLRGRWHLQASFRCLNCVRIHICLCSQGHRGHPCRSYEKPRQATWSHVVSLPRRRRGATLRWPRHQLAASDTAADGGHSRRRAFPSHHKPQAQTGLWYVCGSRPLRPCSGNVKAMNLCASSAERLFPQCTAGSREAASGAMSTEALLNLGLASETQKPVEGLEHITSLPFQA